MPIDQEQVIRALKTNSKLSKGLYESLGEDMQTLKRKVRNEVSRGISQNQSYDQIAKNLAAQTNIGYNNAARIARTEGHRIQNEATLDAQKKAKKAGADIVKQWDASLDARTRSQHAELDGQIREIEEPFTYNGYEAMCPGGFGRPELDINCRCAMTQRAKWALGEEELEELKKRAEYFGLDKTEDFKDYKKKYLNAVDEIEHPFKDKEYHMDPDGNLIEGTSPGHSSYKMDIASDKIYTASGDYDPSKLKKDGYEAIVDGNKIKLLDETKLEAINTVDDLSKETFSLNPDGTFHYGKIKDQAEYKIDIPENQILNLDISNSIKSDAWLFDVDDETTAKYKSLISALNGELEDFELYDLEGEAAKKAFYEKVKEKGYKGVNIINNNEKYQNLIDNSFEVLDDKLVKKTKKGKVEDLTDKLAKEQKALNKIDNKTYSGIWKNDVQLSDYAEKKASIQAKKDYYTTSINNMKKNYDTSPKAAQKIWDKQIADFEKYLDDLDEFEKLGKEYEKQQAKIKKIQTELGKITPKTSGSALYSQTNKDNAYWFTNDNGSTAGADKVLRDKSGDVWRKATKAEREAAYDYTSGSGKFNRPLSGFDYSWSKSCYKGPKNVSLNTERAGKKIKDLTKIIDKSEYDFDIWLQRGCTDDAIESFLNLNWGELSGMTEKQLQQYIGYNNRVYSFMSTSVAKGKGFGGGVTMNIYAPRGSKMIYAEPFSAYGMGDGKNWDGISKQSSYGYEAEMILQRGGSYTITKIEKKGGHIYMDLEVHPEDGYDLFEN